VIPADELKRDAAIVRRVREGDQAAYADLVRLYQARLRSTLSFYCRSAQDVEEHLQNAFVDAYTRLDRFDLSQPWFPWLKTLALNALRMEFRRNSARKLAPNDALKNLQQSAINSEADPDRMGAALRNCLSKLPKEQAELLVAKYQEGRPLSELSKRLGTNVGALKVRLLRLRVALKDCIDRQRIASEQG
jgi:RNA polymerase sigma-70 factor (ECF subfamily)